MCFVVFISSRFSCYWDGRWRRNSLSVEICKLHCLYWYSVLLSWRLERSGRLLFPTILKTRSSSAFEWGRNSTVKVTRASKSNRGAPSADLVVFKCYSKFRPLLSKFSTFLYCRSVTINWHLQFRFYLYYRPYMHVNILQGHNGHIYSVGKLHAW